MQAIDWQQAKARRYEVIIVGAGFAGAVMAKNLSRAGKSVLVLEAGAGAADNFQQHLQHLKTFMRASAKTPNSPYPNSTNAPQPEVTDVEKITPGAPSHKGYFVQEGPYPFESNYTRRLGGTSLHWFGSCPRMLPEDFSMASNFGKGADWPWSYEDLQPYYIKAEQEIGVSAEVSEQSYHGIHFPTDYVYPMHKIPQSYLDSWMIDGLGESPITDCGEPAMIRSIAQARNSIPNANYNGGEGYQPRGAVGNPAIGKRCMGNSSCIPICPIQARYNALKTLTEAQADLLCKTLVSKLHFDANTGKILAIDCKTWRDDHSTEHQSFKLSSDIVVLAANAIENAVILKASNACNSSDQVGRNLMDHPAILSWGLAPESIGAFRGPGLTSTLVNYRGGKFRRERAAFVFEIGNWGWSWPKNEPTDSTNQLVDRNQLFGSELRRQLAQHLPRQIRVDMMTEQLPRPENRIEISENWRDAMGNFRPVIHYNIDDYSKAGMVFARSFSQKIFNRLKISDVTAYQQSDPGFFDWHGKPYSWAGVGHLAGTHRMGTDRHSSVVDKYQRAWDHPNLYLVGCGSMPTLGTSNPTLTMVALAFIAAENILNRAQ